MANFYTQGEVCSNGNMYAVIIMIAEKADDINLGNLPLKPEKFDFYRNPG